MVLPSLVRAAERAASLAATEEAQHAYERAAELSDDPLEQADLHEHAGLMARTGARSEEGAAHYEQAIALFDGAGATHPAARVSARLAEVMWDRGRLDHGLEIMDRSYKVLAEEEPDADLAALAAQLGRFLFFGGRHDLARARIEAALELSEALWLPETFSQALNTKGIMLVSHGRVREGVALLRYALDVALEYDKPSAVLRAYFNLADTLSQGDRYEEAATYVRDGLAFARRVGNRYQELLFLAQTYAFFALGDWEELVQMASLLPREQWADYRQAFGTVMSVHVVCNVHMGRLDEAEEFSALLAELRESDDTQERAAYCCGQARVLLAKGDAEGALRMAEVAIAVREEMGVGQEYVKEGLVAAFEAACELRDVDKLQELLAVIDTLPPGNRPQFLRAQSLRFRAQLAGLTSDADAERLFKGATGLFRELAMPFYLAVTELEHAQWLSEQSRGDEAEPLLTEAKEIFERLGAAPWLDRVAKVGSPAQVPT